MIGAVPEIKSRAVDCARQEMNLDIRHRRAAHDPLDYERNRRPDGRL
jgi:hypothetical protein